MEKSLIIIGRELTGKSRIARAFAAQHIKEEVIFRNGYSLDDPFKYSGANENTKLVVIDEIIEKKELEWLMSLHESIGVHQENGYIEFNPKIIVVCSHKITYDDLLKIEGLQNSYQIIECK
jgi:hypothetical protein